MTYLSSRLSTTRAVLSLGCVLPTSFWEKNEQGVRGGVEAGFMSTTTSRAVAVGYSGGPEAGGEGRAPMVLEMGQGMIDRGADIGFLSQYPHEAEVLFPPLTMLRVVSVTRELEGDGGGGGGRDGLARYEETEGSKSYTRVVVVPTFV